MSLSVVFRHAYPGLTLDIAFTAATPGTTVLMGPSGSGKSTIINAISGLIKVSPARITIDDDVLTDTEAGISLPPERRRIGLVFQDARLFPHLSVLDNLCYGLRRAVSRRIALDDVVEILAIRALLGRRPHALSGGERQRVAVGRALLSQPRLLAMDEPLASLDSARKAEILPYLARLRQALDLPILYVTHDAGEMARLADTLVLLERGRVLSAGPLAEIAARSDLPLAAGDDAGAILAARVLRHDTERRLSLLDAAAIPLFVPLLDLPPGAALRVRIPAREVILATASPGMTSIHNVISGQVRAVTEDAARHAALVEVAAGGAALLARVTPDSVARLCLVPGAKVLALVKSVAVEIIATPPTAR